MRKLVIGSVQGFLDVSERHGLAFEGTGSPIEDTWTILGAGSRNTNGGKLQWHIADPHKPDPASLTNNGLTWRQLPGNERWLDAEKQGRLVYEVRGDKPYPRWFLDGDRVEEIEGIR